MIVVFGSINLDFIASLQTLPKPGETALGSTYITAPGGKGANQALAAARLGAKVKMIGAVGRDSVAVEALALLSEAGVDLTGIRDVEAPTGAAFIGVDDAGENLIMVASGANASVKADWLRGVGISEKDILLVQREVPEQELANAIGYAHAQGARVILNAAPAGPVPPELLLALDTLIVNEHEAGVVARGLGLAETDPENIARAIDATYGVPTIVTLGAAGAIGWTGGVRRPVAAPAITAVDTVGAGDCFCGAFAAAREAGFGFTGALARGVAAGSLACRIKGAQPSFPAKPDLENAMEGWFA
jgi:ribokinase